MRSNYEGLITIHSNQARTTTAQHCHMKVNLLPVVGVVGSSLHDLTLHLCIILTIFSRSQQIQQSK